MSVDAEFPPKEPGSGGPALARGAVGAVLFAGVVGLFGWWLGTEPVVDRPPDGLAPEATTERVAYPETAAPESDRREERPIDVAIETGDESRGAPDGPHRPSFDDGPLAAEWSYLDRTLSGQVLRNTKSHVIEDFIPLPYAEIELHFALGSEWFHTERIQADGEAHYEYDLAALHPHVGSACNVGELRMDAFVTHAAATGEAEASVPSLWDLLVGNSVEQDLVVWLPSWARVRGRVVDERGKAIDGLGIELAIDGLGIKLPIDDRVFEGETNQRGEFEIETPYRARHPFEEYRRRFPDPPDVTIELRARSDLHGALNQRFELDPETPVFDCGTLTLQGEWTLSGEVLSQDGHPLPGVDLRVSRSDGHETVWIDADDQGRFRYRGEPGHEYQLRLGTNSFGTAITATAPAHDLVVLAPGPTATVETLDVEQRPLRGQDAINFNPCRLNAQGRWEYVEDYSDCLIYIGDETCTVLFPIAGTYETATAWDGIAGVWSIEQRVDVREGHQWIRAFADFHPGLRLEDHVWRLETVHRLRDQ